jgi:ABC-type nitrate/sulfonate/bicarbonate transport system ATPase subunit
MRIEIKNISKEITAPSGFKELILKNVSLSIQDGEIAAIVSPPGLTASYLLKIVSGLEKPDAGEIVNHSGGRILYFPAEPSSFPWLNVHENVVFGLGKYSAEEIDRFIKIVGLEGYERHHPHNGSTGFRFRISLARSLAHNPAAILLDNPFSIIDQLTREEIYPLLREISKKLSTTIILVTSNISEALLLSDRIFILGKGTGDLHPALEIEDEDIPVRKSNLPKLLQSILGKLESKYLSEISI